MRDMLGRFVNNLTQMRVNFMQSLQSSTEIIIQNGCGTAKI